MQLQLSVRDAEKACLFDSCQYGMQTASPTDLDDIEGSVCGRIFLKVIDVLRDAGVAQALMQQHSTAQHDTSGKKTAAATAALSWSMFQ